MKVVSLEENGEDMKNEMKVVVMDEDVLMRIVKNWKRFEERIFVERDLIKFVVFLIIFELIFISEMLEYMRILFIDFKYKE